MAKKQIVSRVRRKSGEAESWENTAEFKVPLPEPEEIPEEPEIPQLPPVPESAPQKTDTIYWLLLVLILLIILVALTGFISVRNLHQSLMQIPETSVQETQPVFTEPETLPPTEKETIRIEVPEEPPSDMNTELSDFSDFSALLSDMYQQYFQLLEEHAPDACKGGYLTDINQDGLDEMILFTDAEPACYEIFTYQNKKAVLYGTFGSYSTYLYFSESCLYQMTGRDGSIYLHYQDNYDEQMIAGYYSARNRNALSVLLEYGLSKNQNYRIKWHIFYESAEAPLAELNSGSTLVGSLYEIPVSCQKKTDSYLEEYSFWIADVSSQIRLDFLDYEALSLDLQMLSGN